MFNAKKTLTVFCAVFTLVQLSTFTTDALAKNVFINNKTALLICAKENNNIKRLACFDNLVEKINNKVNPQPANKPTPIAKNVAGTNPSNLSTGVTSNQSKITADFGQEYKLKPQELALKQVEFTVKSATLTIRKYWHLVFENGQVWRTTESSNFIKFKAGNVVIIKRGIFNSFSLKKKGSKRRVRAKRIK